MIEEQEPGKTIMISAMPRVAIAVDDFDAVLSTFGDTFGMPVLDLSVNSVDNLGARLGMCVPEGGSNIELMSPAIAEAPLSKSLQKFLDRRGQGLFALMLEAAVPDDEAEILLKKGMNVLPVMAGATGRDIHPVSTHGVLIRIYPINSFKGTTAESDNDLGLSGIFRVMIAVRDIEAAKEVYGTKLGLEVECAETDVERGVEKVVCRPPSGGRVDLIAPVDTDNAFAANVEDYLGAKGEGLYALVLQSADLESTRSALIERGVGVTGDSILELPLTDTFGARIFVESP
ncbi:MAG: hypothetical protein HOE54_07820 [Gammaproteobacteria bacterium]|nr:hypothetical protein [Gammaproteobacteria bacterium]